MPHSNLTITALVVAGVVVGIFVLRSFLHWVLQATAWIASPRNMRERIVQRFQGKNFHAWMFARCKTASDGMFAELPDILQPVQRVQHFLDIGAGFGITSCFLVEHFENSTAYAIEPRTARVQAAAAALGNRGRVYQAMAPDFEQPDFPARFDIIFALDMIHFLSDSMLDLMLKRIRNRLDDGHCLILRNPILPSGRKSIQYISYRLVARLRGTPMWFRPADQVIHHIRKAGFNVAQPRISSSNPELYWFIATASPIAMSAGDEPGNESQRRNHMQQHQPEPVDGGKLVQLLQRSQSP